MFARWFLQPVRRCREGCQPRRGRAPHRKTHNKTVANKFVVQHCCCTTSIDKGHHEEIRYLVGHTFWAEWD